MPHETTVVIRTGVANLASILVGLQRAGARATITDDALRVAAADRVILPGVGSFEPAMAHLRERRLVQPLAQRIRDGRPTLAICLGLQLLGAGSEECPGTAGLGVFAARAARFDGDTRIPQLGWNFVRPEAGCALVQSGYAYFANSYRLVECPQNWRVTWAEHGGRFVAALECGPVLACQFHPELSGTWGITLLRRWIVGMPSEVGAC